MQKRKREMQADLVILINYRKGTYPGRKHPNISTKTGKGIANRHHLFVGHSGCLQKQSVSSTLNNKETSALTCYSAFHTCGIFRATEQPEEFCTDVASPFTRDV